MKSMTGYGRGECARSGFKVIVELSSVNRRQTEISFHLPREIEALEAPMRELIHRHISRGRLTVRVTLHSTDGGEAARLHLNVRLARAYARELARLARQLRLPGPITLEHLLRAPGVFQTDEELADAERLRPAVEQALQRALRALVKTRQREGAHLARDLTRRIAAMRRAVERIRARAPRVVERYRRQLLARIRNAGLKPAAGEDERLLREVVLFADRSDISEELARLQSHFDQFDHCLRAREPVGRMLDFLAQEMNREINTIGAKANDALIARQVVTLKAEVERFREQAQNVE